MVIGWFTVVAQAVNFLILAWLLKRFLYKPILHAIDEREKGIAGQRAEAEAKKAEAQRERDEFRRKNEADGRERAALLKKAADEAGAERARLLDEARKDADALRAKREEALRTEQHHLNQEILRWTQEEVFAIARKALADLAATTLEERMGEVFVGRLRGLSGAARDRLAAALRTKPDSALVRSAFELPPAQRAAIESAVRETFDVKAQVQFQTAPGLVAGVELSANGHKVAWSIADYLARLEKSAGELLRVEGGPESEPDAHSKPGTRSAARAKPEAEAEAKPGLEAASSAPQATNEHLT